MYEFRLEFDIPVSYPRAPPELCLPELDGKTMKMYRGGKICTDTHFKPLWAKNAPRFGLAHCLALGLGPWLSAEVPFLIAEGKVAHRSASQLADRLHSPPQSDSESENDGDEQQQQQQQQQQGDADSEASQSKSKRLDSDNGEDLAKRKQQ